MLLVRPIAPMAASMAFWAEENCAIAGLFGDIDATIDFLNYLRDWSLLILGCEPARDVPGGAARFGPASPVGDAPLAQADVDALIEHFMNTLTALSEWIEQEPATAVRMIESLADELRVLAAVSTRRLVPAAEELHLCRTHLENMGLRRDITYALETDGVDGASHLGHGFVLGDGVGNLGQVLFPPLRHKHPELHDHNPLMRSRDFGQIETERT